MGLDRGMCSRHRFPHVGQLVPPSWVRCSNFIDALRVGADPRTAATHDPATGGVDLLPDVGMARDFIFRGEMNDLWAECCSVVGNSNGGTEQLLSDVLSLREAVGEVLIMGGIVHVSMRPGLNFDGVAGVRNLYDALCCAGQADVAY